MESDCIEVLICKDGSKWLKYETDDGIEYWYNPESKESVWENPNEQPQEEQAVVDQ